MSDKTARNGIKALLAAASIALALTGCTGGIGGDGAAEGTPAPIPTNPPVAQIGSEFKSGYSKFIVNEVGCTTDAIAGVASPSGTYCFADLTVKYDEKQFKVDELTVDLRTQKNQKLTLAEVNSKVTENPIYGVMVEEDNEEVRGKVYFTAPADSKVGSVAILSDASAVAPVIIPVK